MKIRLFDGPITLAQQVIIGLWGVGLFAVTALWALTLLQNLSTTASIVIAVSLLAGLLATYFALIQFMLMSRIGWIEQEFGLDRLASFHRINGYSAIILMLIHVPLITLGYAMQAHVGYLKQYFDLIFHYQYVIFASFGLILFLVIIGSSIYIARKRLKFETWYYVHLMAYLAIIFVSLHQFAIGRSFQTNSAYFYGWLGLYLFVAVNVLVYRFGFPVYNLYRFGFRVAKVEAETGTATNVYISAKDVERLGVVPGQFILVRFFQAGFIYEEHPFTVSQIPKGDMLRLTIRKSGDFTEQIPQLKVGTKVLVSGPFGRFTHNVEQKSKRLLIAGGVGITPIHSLLQESVASTIDSVVLFGNRDSSDVPLKREVEVLSRNASVSFHPIYSDEEVSGAEKGYVSGELIERLVPDYKQRDIFLCGPPVMMIAIITDLKKLGIDESLLHYEQFGLHP